MKPAPVLRRQLVVNGDDFGFTPDVNDGIVEGHRHGILTATTLMANGDAFDHAVRLARQVPSLDIGCHLVLIGGHSLLTGKPLPRGTAQFLAALARREIPVFEELAAQVRRILDSGVTPTHLDTHKHTHLAPPVLDAVALVGEKFAIPWVRRPFDIPLNAVRGTAPFLKRRTSDAFGLFRRRFQSVLRKHGCRATDHFAGFQITGRFRAAQLVRLFDALPAGSTELMCHPGRCGEALEKAPTRLKHSREQELEALMASEVRQALQRNSIELVSYRDL